MTTGYGHTPDMATMTIKSTYSMDVETVRALESLARRWKVSKSEALRRAIRGEAERQATPVADAIAALEELQESFRSRGVDLAEWEREMLAERRAWGPRDDSP